MLKLPFQDSGPRANIAYLRFRIDTLGQNFIYEEGERLKNYSPIVLCGNIERVDRKVRYYCYEEFMKLYQQQWPIFPKAHEEIYRKGISRYKEIIKKEHIRLLHAQFLPDAVFYYRLIKECHLPLIINLRGHDLFVPRLRSFLPHFLPFVSKFVVKSESMKKELISFGCDPSKIEVIYGGINIDNIIFKPRIAAKDNIKILCAGRFVDKKGFDVTLKFFYRFLKVYPQAELTLVGEGREKEHVVKLIKNLKLKTKVRIKDFMPHSLFIKELYKHNLFLLPSRTAKDGDQEGIPNVLKEAMASGMPVVSTRHSGIPELIIDNETGYLVKENDHAEILDKVSSILKNKKKAFQICLNARFFVEKFFDARKTAQQIERLYDYLLMPDYAKSVVDLNKGKRPKKFRADLHLIKGCNSKCMMCDNWKSDIVTSFSREDVSRTLKHLKLFGVDHVRFHGQEPTLRKDLFSIMEEAKKKGFKVGLKTNALIFVSEGKVKMLKGIVDDLYLSVDSPVEKMHNLLRGQKRSFARNMSLAQNIRKISPDVRIYFNAVVTRLNYRDLPGLLDAAGPLKVGKVSFVHLNRQNKKNIDKIKLSKQQFREFYLRIWPQILKKSQQLGIPVSVDPCFYSLSELPVDAQIKKLTKSPGEFAEEIDDFSRGLYGKKFYSRNICYGVLDHVTIDWEGNVYPCCAMPRLPELAIGNLHSDNFLKIWNSKKYIKYRSDILKGACRFKEKCSRGFKKTAALNDYLRKEDRRTDRDEISGLLRHHSRDNKYRSKYNLERMIYYSLSQSKFYREKFEEFIDVNRKLDIPKLPFIKRDALKYSFPKKEIVPNYFEEDYGVYRTSSCGSNAFLYARPLQSNISSRITTSFIHTGKWGVGQPWLKLTSLNCLEARYPLADFSSHKENGKRQSAATIIPPSDNFINAPIADIKEIYRLIKDSGASLIHANPTYLKILLWRLRKEKMPLDGHYTVHSTYEVLLPSTKELIKKYLNCSVFNQYGCSEVGPVSFSCRYGNNHIFNDTVHVEVVPADDLNRPGTGRVVITHLKNHVMPFVKYFNGDFAYVLKDKKCRCGLGSPLMGDIIGREDEAINYKGQRIFPLELDTLFYDLQNILMYQVAFEDGEFFVKVVPENKALSISEKKLVKRFKTYFKDNDLRVRIEKVEFILPKRRGKYASVLIK